MPNCISLVINTIHTRCSHSSECGALQMRMKATPSIENTYLIENATTGSREGVLAPHMRYCCCLEQLDAGLQLACRSILDPRQPRRPVGPQRHIVFDFTLTASSD